MDMLGILIGLGLLIWLAFRGWSVLILSPLAAILAAALAGAPLLANWTQTFMSGAGAFVAQFLPLFLLGAVFGKLMDDSGSIRAIAAFVSERLGSHHASLAVVIIGALVTYGGVNMIVAFFVIVPMAQTLFQSAGIPRRLMPAAVGLGTFTFTMTALPGTPALQNAIPMPYFGTTLFAAPGLGLIGAAIMFVFGMWWMGRAEAAARRRGETYTESPVSLTDAAADLVLREKAMARAEFDTAEIAHGCSSKELPSIVVAALPLAAVLCVNVIMAFVVLPRLDVSYLAEERWGATSLAAVGGVWSVLVALAAGILTLIALNRKRLTALRETMDAGANASVLPLVSVASLVGFGAVVAGLPAFATMQDLVLSIEGGPLVSLATSVNVLAAMTGSASGGMTIALDALGDTYLALAARHGIDPALMHRVAVMSSGTLDALPHNGAIVTLLSVCGTTHRESYGDVVMTVIVGPVIALVAVIALGAAFGSF
jgi:H+/gluconate symporter-like permease